MLNICLTYAVTQEHHFGVMLGRFDSFFYESLHISEKSSNFVAKSTLEGYVLRKVFRNRFFFG